jgi:hypothetical protein
VITVALQVNTGFVAIDERRFATHLALVHLVSDVSANRSRIGTHGVAGAAVLRGIVRRRTDVVAASTDWIDDVKLIEPGAAAAIYVTRVAAITTELPVIAHAAPAVTAETAPTLTAPTAKPMVAANVFIATVVALSAV